MLKKLIRAILLYLRKKRLSETGKEINDMEGPENINEWGFNEGAISLEDKQTLEMHSVVEDDALLKMIEQPSKTTGTHVGRSLSLTNRYQSTPP